MAIKFFTDSPNKLLSTFKKAIDDGHVTTWAYDKDGDFTHTAQQWKHLAWLRPTIVTGQLVLNTIKPQDKNITWEVYGIYHGRFIESMIIHCHGLFANAQATASPTTDDKV